MGLDIGPETVRRYSDDHPRAKTIVWNGPMGVFENPKFAARHFCDCPRRCGIESVLDRRRRRLGGGRRAVRGGIEDHAYFTGGGASLEFLSGQKLPGCRSADGRR